MRSIITTILMSFLCPLVLIGQTNEILKVSSYKLQNGFTVFLNEDPTANKIFGAVMVNTGAKHESPEATGMAHYLEHLLFKGTETFGSSNYEKEKPFLDSINVLYEQLGQTVDEKERLRIQKAINEQAVQASKYGLPNEFDKLLKSIGSTGINAFTNYEMTYYHNSFPAHEVYKWLDVYAQRFQNPVFRSFQSELEVVYEEKNRNSDDFESKVTWEMEKLLFPNLPYGQWSVLGKTEHLKNPPINKMYEFFNKYYVANNMALILCGNFSAADVKAAIQEKFGKLKAGNVKPLNLPTATPFNGREVSRKRMTPVKAGFFGYQTVGYTHPDRLALDVCEYLLSNDSRTGYIDQIQLNNEMLYCGAFPSTYNDAGGYTIFYVPKVLVQSLKAGEKKVQKALDHLKKGTFTDQQLFAAKNNLGKYFNQRLESLRGRGVMIGQAFNRNKTWEEYLEYPTSIQQVTKEEVMRVAQKYFGEDMANMISRTGFPKKDKLAKPPYKPIVTDQKEESDYVAEYNQIPSLPFKPRFIDFSKDVESLKLKGGHQLLMSKNPVNDVFYLTIKFKTGKLQYTDLYTSVSVINFSGAAGYSFSQFKEAFAAIGCSYSFRADANYLTMRIEGNEAELEKCLKLTAKILHEPVINETEKEALLNDITASRKLEKRTPSTLGRSLFNYAVLGDESPYLQRKTEKELKKLEPSSYLNTFKEITKNYQTALIFVGNTSKEQLANMLEKELQLAQNGKADPFVFLEGNPIPKNKILFVDDKKARQSQVYFYVLGEESGKEEFGKGKAFQQYFSGGFSGLVLQEIREYRSLAYSAGANLSPSPLPTGKTRLFGFIGCQADKTSEAVEVMVGLLSELPQKKERIPTLQQNLQLQVLTNFPTFSQIPNQVLDYQRKGFTEDPNKEAYAFYQALKMEDLLAYYEKHIKGKPMVITIYGDKSKIDMEALKKFGQVEELKLEQIIKF